MMSQWFELYSVDTIIHVYADNKFGIVTTNCSAARYDML